MNDVMLVRARFEAVFELVATISRAAVETGVSPDSDELDKIIRDALTAAGWLEEDFRAEITLRSRAKTLKSTTNTVQHTNFN